MFPTVFVFVALTDVARGRIQDVGLVTATVIAAAALAKLAWHPRSWFHRAPCWLFRRIVSEPLSRKSLSAAERFVERVITPKIDAVLTDLAAVSERNDAQHAVVEVRLAGVEAKLSEQNTKLIDLASLIVATPGLPVVTGELPVTNK